MTPAQARYLAADGHPDWTCHKDGWGYVGRRRGGLKRGGRETIVRPTPEAVARAVEALLDWDQYYDLRARMSRRKFRDRLRDELIVSPLLCDGPADTWGRMAGERKT